MGSTSASPCHLSAADAKLRSIAIEWASRKAARHEATLMIAGVQTSAGGTCGVAVRVDAVR
ncbi:hypothetical protein NSPZN2_11451 [Nitrospira defluvii]|uniref:XdhC- CoxI domain-containing protein n=1 Tax=Nitrospira defluvii TaxID=330214 RepID=A0ABN7KVP9_9BACT|nr:hypothetical protein NSPZN2_11451 [Nitrospira defluvii]